MESASTSALILRIANQYSIYLGSICFAAGIIGNFINILIFTRLKFFRTNRCVFYLTIESISDIIYQFYNISLTIIRSFYGSDLTENSLIRCRTKYIVSQSTSLITFYMIGLAAADQFFSTSYRFILRGMCTMKLARYLTFIIITIFITHSIIFSFAFNTIPSAGCILSHSTGIRYGVFFFYPLLLGFLPITIAASFSLLAFRNVRRIIRRQLSIERRRFDRQITAMVLIRVVFFVIFLLPYGVNRIYVINHVITQTNLLTYTILTSVQAVTFSIYNLNFTANFYIFIASSSRYRRQVKHVLVKKCWKPWKTRFSLRKNEVHPEHSQSAVCNNELE